MPPRSVKELKLNDEFTIYFTGTVMDEECDGLCWQYILNEDGLRPEAVVIAEPTNLAVYRGHRGRMEIEVLTRGVSCHGSAPERGTTYIHNMLSLDTTFGFCSTFTATVPGVFLGSEKIFKPVLAGSITPKRPMDDVPMGTDLPQEEEYAIGAFTPYAYYNGWIFPKNMGFYNKFVCMENVSKDVINEWKETYLYFLKKLTYYRDGKRLILKNPGNTARIKLLLEMFPDAQFINIYRNPYDLYYSMMRFLRIVFLFIAYRNTICIKSKST